MNDLEALVQKMKQRPGIYEIKEMISMSQDQYETLLDRSALKYGQYCARIEAMQKEIDRLYDGGWRELESVRITITKQIFSVGEAWHFFTDENVSFFEGVVAEIQAEIPRYSAWTMFINAMAETCYGIDLMRSSEFSYYPGDNAIFIPGNGFYKITEPGNFERFKAMLWNNELRWLDKQAEAQCRDDLLVKIGVPQSFIEDNCAANQILAAQKDYARARLAEAQAELEAYEENA